MKVSIITPCYNAEKFIKCTITTIQNQTLTDWEMIIVDDGSTDNSVKIIKSIIQKDSRIKLIQQPNGGTASARNYGLSLAKGDYIQFLDADDTIDKEKLKRQVDLMDKKGLDVSYSDWCIIYPDGHTDSIHGLHCNLARLLTIWGPFGTLPIHSFMYNRQFIHNHGITFPTQAREREDWDFHIEVFSAHPKVERIANYCGAMYMQSPTGKTTGASIEKKQLGTFRFLTYKIEKTKGIKKICLYLRFSVELFIWGFRKIKYNNEKSLLSYCHSNNFKKTYMAGLLLLPLSSIISLISIIQNHINHNRYSTKNQ